MRAKLDSLYPVYITKRLSRTGFTLDPVVGKHLFGIGILELGNTVFSSVKWLR